MDHFPFLKECLIKFKYPNIHSMDDLEIADIFSNVNRYFLVSWILKQIDKDYGEIVENALKEELGDILYLNGFCTNTQKVKFMNGECDSDTQFKILYRMFEYMNSLSESENKDEMKPFSNEELKDLLEFDTNLLPVYGKKQILNSTQREKKIIEYQEEIENLKYLDVVKTSKEIKNATVLDSQLKNELLCTMMKIEGNAADFQRTALNLIEHKNEENGIEFKENFAETLKISNKEAAVVSNLIANMNVVLNFVEENGGLKDLNSNNRNRDILHDTYKLCDDVIAASK